MQSVMRKQQTGKQDQGSVFETTLTKTDPRHVQFKEDLEDLSEICLPCPGLWLII